MQGTMQDRPLTLPHIFHRAEKLAPAKEVVTATATGLERSTYAEWAARTRRLGGVLDDLGISADGRVATFAWNTARHLELYFAAPCSGRVLHTLNIRLFPEQVTYIVNHAEDEVIFVDRSLLGLLGPLLPTFTTVKHVVVMEDGGQAPDPDGVELLDYERLLADATSVEFRVDDEFRAASMCYTSGTTGNPKGVVYTHRSTFLHTMGTMLADSIGACETDVILPVVPMFHANAWGLAHAGVATGAKLVMPGPNMVPAKLAELIETEKVTLAAGVPTIWMGVLPELVGPRHLVAARHPVRWFRGAQGAVRGVPRADRPPDPAGMGHDRDQPGRVGGQHHLVARRPARGRAGRRTGQPGPPCARRRAAHRGPVHRRGAAVGRGQPR